MSTQPRRNWTVKHFAEQAGVAQSTVRAWITEGKINVIRLGRRVFIRDEEAEKILNNGL